MTDTVAAPSSADASARALLRERDFMLMWVARLVGVLGTAAQGVAMGWQIYAIARDEMPVAEAALWIGMLGLVTFLPLFVLALPAGELADRYARKKILLICYTGEIASAVALVVAAIFDFTSIPYLLAVAFGFGVSRAFRAPAGTALAPMLVPRALLPRAIAWNSLAFMIGNIVGPALAGLLVAISYVHAYGVSCGLYLIAFALLALIRRPTKPQAQPGSRIALIKEGLAYVWRTKVVLGALSLDLFAVLLGSVMALLPVYAKDILHVGEQGFGLLRAAPAVGGAAVSLYVALWPPRRHAGLVMFAGVAVFALMTLVFAVSRDMWLSLAALVVMGGADMFSVFTRQTLVQIVTPDPMRGRVAAVSFVFIGASNELGEFESGVTARIFGPVGAALFGGFAALGVTGLWAYIFPSLRKADRLE